MGGSEAGAERAVRGIRGAITVERDDAALVRAATRELLAELSARNGIGPDDVVSAFFTVTPDLASEFPARGARDFGWHDVPLLCGVAVAVPGDVPRCVRALLHVTTARARAELQHVYLREARALRPDPHGD